jgi:hypothetical protein
MRFVFEHYPEYGAGPNFGPFFNSLRVSAENTENDKTCLSLEKE